MTQSTRGGRDGFIRPAAADRSVHRAGRPSRSQPKSVAQGRRPTGGRQRGGAAAGRQSDAAATMKMPALAAVLLLVVVAVVGVRAIRHRHDLPAAQTSAPSSQPRPPAASFWVDPQYVAGYQGQLAAYLAGTPGKFGVIGVDLTSGATFGVNQDETFRAASVNKLELAVSLYRRAVAHQIDLNASTTIAEDDIQNYGTGTIQLQGAGQRYTYRELAQLMIKESDNTASYVIGKRLGLENVQTELPAWGLTQTSMSDNYTTPRDVATLLSKLETGALLPASETAELMDLLQHTAWDDRLQSGVPPSMPVAHKIGTDVAVFNDAALILDQAHPYAVVALSSGGDEGTALPAMAQISQIFYRFESGLPAYVRKLQ